MIYVALLRGINVGGKNKVDMKQLKAVFADAGMTTVTTYINSGNVVFSSRSKSRTKLAARLEEAIAESFGFDVKVLVRSLHDMRTTVAAIDPDWVNDRRTMTCDVLFLWDEADRPDVVDEFTIKPGVDEVRYVPGALIWKVDAENITKTEMMKAVPTPLYKQITARNCNTARKLLALMESV